MALDIYLKPLNPAHIDHVMTWVNDPDLVKNFQHFNKKFTKKEELAFIKTLIKSKNNKVFSIFRKSDKAYLGQGAINQISWENKLGRLAIFIKKEYWNKGYAKQAIRLVLKHAFNNLKLHKVWLMVYASNKKSIQIYEKFGFKKEALLRDEYFWKGKYHNIIRMAMLKKEFKEI